MIKVETKTFIEENTKYLVAFNHIDGVGAVSIRKMWDYFNCMKSAWNSSPSELHSIPGLSSNIIEKIIFNRQNIDPGKIIESVLSSKINILSFIDPEFPLILNHLYDAPTIMYYQGNINQVDFEKTISIVGTRIPSEYGKAATKSITEELTRYNISIVSGLAEGIDKIAHQSCLNNGGSTIAVLGSGLNRIYPTSNVNLFRNIIDSDKGVIFSEYPPDTPPESWRFPYRNRIICGLSAGVIVIESKLTGGAMITAKMALEENRVICALPTRADEKILNGTNHLIKSHKASIFISSKDLIDELGWEIIMPQEQDILLDYEKKEPEILHKINDPSNSNTVKASEKEEIKQDTNKKEFNYNIQNIQFIEKEIVSVLTKEPTKFDILTFKTGIEPAKLLSVLTILELNGIILQHPGKQYSLL